MNRALFLDRDGVVNVDKSYIYKIDDFKFINGIFDLIIYAQKLGYLIFIITNQSGIARGYYSQEDFHILCEWMEQQFRNKGIIISKIYYSPYHPEYNSEKYQKYAIDRKPNPGMILKAKNEFNIDLNASVLIGDKEIDIETGINAKVGTNILFNINEEVLVATKADHIIKKLTDAQLYINSFMSL